MDDKRVAAIYKELEAYSIEVLPDGNPKQLANLVHVCRNYLNNVSLLIQEISKEKRALAKKLGELQAVYDIESEDLLVTDTVIMSLPSLTDRRAAIANRLREKAKELQAIQSDIDNLVYVEKVVAHKHHDLRDTMQEIRLQKSLIQAEVQTGSFYGDERAVKDSPVESNDWVNAIFGGLGIEDPKDTPVEAAPVNPEGIFVEPTPIPETPTETTVQPSLEDSSTDIEDIQQFLGSDTSAKKIAAAKPVLAVDQDLLDLIDTL